MKNNTLTGIHVKLRALEPDDAELLFSWENDTSIWDVSNTIAPFSRFQIEEYVLNSRQDIFTARQLRLMVDVIDPAESREPAGTIDLFDFDPLHHRAGVGILIREPYRKKGYAMDAMQIFIQYAFTTLQLHQLYCNISPDNVSSLKLFEKLGFVRCGIKKEWIRGGQKWHDEWMYQLIHHDR
ncbi:MAG: GNAT family N-acetyltransferase [Bacteroidetes bacterium]|nr:GNAT family N-acetyltransferase [Bacteroidota bacterium]